MGEGGGSSTISSTLISLKLDPTITELFSPQPLELSLGDEPSMDEMAEAINKSMPNWKAVGPEGLPAGLPQLDQPHFI